MAGTCDVPAMWYVLPMILGRTYDMNTNTIGLDIFEKKYIDAAIQTPVHNSVVYSDYIQVEDGTEKRDFLGISAELALKISSGLLDIKGSGDYLRSTFNEKKNFEILVKTTFQTVSRQLDADAEPKKEWPKPGRKSVGTHVINSIQYGGMMYASVRFVALRDEYMREIKAAVKASLLKKGAFDIKAEGNLDMITKNLSSKAKIEIEYYGTVPMDIVPTSVEDLSKLIHDFQNQVERINNGMGVPICVKFQALSKWNTTFSFLRNMELQNELDKFNEYFNRLLEAKGILKDIIQNLPDNAPSDYIKKLVDFSERLTKSLGEFHNAIANMDLEQGTNQLSKAMEAFDANKKVRGLSGYTKELELKIGRLDLEAHAIPRAVFVEWGSQNCSYNRSNLLYTGVMVGHFEQALGGGSEYLCAPLNPDLALPSNAKVANGRSPKLTGVRYQSMFEENGKHVQDKVAPCAVCETVSRPNAEVFPGVPECPVGWMEEYSGFLVSTPAVDRIRAQFACVHHEPQTIDSKSEPNDSDPRILPVVSSADGSKENGAAAIPCFVCSK